MKKKIFLLPHQDDELGVFEILNKHTNKKNLTIIYLTGERNSLKIKARNNESLEVLKKFGINVKNIFFLGDKLRIEDQHLIYNLEKIYKNLKEVLKGKKFDLFTPTWEGGHPDHDATFLIAVKLKKRINFNHYHFPLYSKKNSIFFNLLTPNQYAGKNFNIKLSKYNLKDALYYLRLTFKYQSQIKTFIILWPFLILFYLFIRTQYTFYSKNFILEPPGCGKLWYEKRYKITFQKVNRIAKKFLRK